MKNNFREKIVFNGLNVLWEELSYPGYLTDFSIVNECLNSLENNRREKTRKFFEKLQRKFPKDYRLTHFLFLINYHETVSNHNRNKLKWHKIIANGVFLLNAESFWKEWLKERQAFYFQGKLSEIDIEELCNDLKSDIEAELPDSYKNDLLLELQTIESIRELLEWGVQNGLKKQILIAGPKMYQELKLTKKINRLVKYLIKIYPNNDSFKLLSTYFSPLGKAAAVLVNNRIEDALSELTEIQQQLILANDFFCKLFNNKCIVWANNPKQVEEKIRRFEKAAQIIRSQEILYELAENYHISAMNQLQKSKENINDIINTLRKALECHKSSMIVEDLAFCLNQRAIERSNELLKEWKEL